MRQTVDSKADLVKQIKDTFRPLREKEEELLRQVDQKYVKEELQQSKQSNDAPQQSEHSDNALQQFWGISKQSTVPIVQFATLVDVKKVCENFQLSTAIQFRWTDSAFRSSAGGWDVKRPIHLASWNLDNFDNDKVDEDGGAKLNALCDVIDKNGYVAMLVCMHVRT